MELFQVLPSSADKSNNDPQNKESPAATTTTTTVDPTGDSTTKESTINNSENDSLPSSSQLQVDTTNSKTDDDSNARTKILNNVDSNNDDDNSQRTTLKQQQQLCLQQLIIRTLGCMLCCRATCNLLKVCLLNTAAKRHRTFILQHFVRQMAAAAVVGGGKNDVDSIGSIKVDAKSVCAVQDVCVELVQFLCKLCNNNISSAAVVVEGSGHLVGGGQVLTPGELARLLKFPAPGGISTQACI